MHISKLGKGKRLASVEEAVQEGDTITVLVEDVDAQGKISLKPVGPEWEVPEGQEAPAGGGGERRGGGGGGGDRDRDRGPRTDRHGKRFRDREGGGDAAARAPSRTMPITRSEFTSGLRVVTERMPGVRSVSLGFWVLAGSRDERPAISGHCHFLEHLLFKGTTTRTALDIAEAFDAVGGDVNAFTAKEYTCYYARVLDRDLEMAVEHLADMLEHSTIQPDDLEAESRVILSEIDMHEDSPEDVVHDLFTETLWPGHPLGRPILGTRARIRAATRASVRGFYRRHYVPGRLVVAAAGNVKHEDLVRLLSRSDGRRARAVGPWARPRGACATHAGRPGPPGST